MKLEETKRCQIRKKSSQVKQEQPKLTQIDLLTERSTLLKRISDLEKEVKFLKMKNQELRSQLKQQNSQVQEDSIPKVLLPTQNISRNSNFNSLSDNWQFALTLNTHTLSSKAHKRVISEKLTLPKKKPTQYSDDITKSGIFKKSNRPKPKSYGEYSIKTLEDKIFKSILKEFRKDFERNQEKGSFLPSKNNVAIGNSISNSIGNSNNRNKLAQSVKPKKQIAINTNISNSNIPLKEYKNLNTVAQCNSIKNKVCDMNTYQNSKEHLNTNNDITNLSNELLTINQNNVSEKEERSSIATQETILMKPNNFSITNSFSSTSHNNNVSNNNPNNLSNSLLNSSSLKNFDNSFGCQLAKKEQNKSQNTNTNNTFNKDDSLSRSSIIFQPEKKFKSSSGRGSSSNSSSSKYLYNPIAILKFHLDTVRDVYIDPTGKILSSVSEDSTVCFWDIDKSIKYYKDNPEPYMTFRIHTTPVFTITGPQTPSTQLNSMMSVYTSGVDGVIRPIRIPDIKTVNCEETINKCTSLPQWRAHQDMIWQLNYHPHLSLMSSVSSDGTVKIFKCYEENNNNSIKAKHFYSYDSSTKNLVRNFMFRNRYYNFVEIPTSSCWDEGNDSVLYVSHIASYIKIYDTVKGQSAGDLVYNVEKNVPYESQQANRILFLRNNLIVTGHEDRQLRFFDTRTGSMTRNYVAHADSISCLCRGIGEFDLLTASHDGTVRCWDLRGDNNKLVFDIPAHRKKFDEGCLSLNVIRVENTMITSGADGIIKIFKI